jgi:hypothetical protein
MIDPETVGKLKTFFITFAKCMTEEDLSIPVPVDERIGFLLYHGFAMGLQLAQQHPEYAMALKRLGFSDEANLKSIEAMPRLIPLEMAADNDTS